MNTIQLGKKVCNMFWELRDLCYADDIDEFDALHDDLFYQAEGIYQSVQQAIEERENGEGYEKEFKEALELANDIKKYREQLIASPLDDSLFSKEFNWIYG